MTKESTQKLPSRIGNHHFMIIDNRSWSIIKNRSPLLIIISEHEMSPSSWWLFLPLIMKDHEFTIFQNGCQFGSLSTHQMLIYIVVSFPVQFNRIGRAQKKRFCTNGRLWNESELILKINLVYESILLTASWAKDVPGGFFSPYSSHTRLDYWLSWWHFMLWIDFRAKSFVKLLLRYIYIFSILLHIYLSEIAPSAYMHARRNGKRACHL